MNKIKTVLLAVIALLSVSVKASITPVFTNYVVSITNGSCQCPALALPSGTGYQSAARVDIQAVIWKTGFPSATRTISSHALLIRNGSEELEKSGYDIADCSDVDNGEYLEIDTDANVGYIFLGNIETLDAATGYQVAFNISLTPAENP